MPPANPAHVGRLVERCQLCSAPPRALTAVAAVARRPHEFGPELVEIRMIVAKEQVFCIVSPFAVDYPEHLKVALGASAQNQGAS